MQFPRKSVLIPALLAAGIGLAEADEDPELVNHMSSMQYLAHKAGLAIDHKNHELAKFYAHELEEQIEQVEGIDSYDGHPIGTLTRSILVPAFEKLEAALDEGQWEKSSTRFDAFIDKCNDCHLSSDHDYIQIRRSTSNPFMQSFEPPGEGN